MFQAQSPEERRKDLRDLDSSLADVYKEKMELQKRLKHLEEVEKEIIESRKEIVNLHLVKSGEDLLAKEREIVVSDLIQACSNHAHMRFEGNKIQYSMAAVSPQVKKALQECYEYDITPEFVSSILFIFSLTGNEIDLNNIKDLDPEKPKDRDMIERIAVYLNEETDFAIRTCMDMIPEEDRSRLFYNKIEEIKKALIDFKEPKRKYDMYMTRQKREKRKYLHQARLKDYSGKNPIPGEEREAA